jgi:phage-related protein
VNTANGYTDIDCEMMNCYKGSINCNGNVTMTTGNFFELKEGNNTVTYSGFSAVEITPRWWKI